MSSRDRVILILVVSVAAVVAGWMLLVSPRRDTASRLGNQVTATQSQLSSLESTLAQHELARAAFSASYSELSRLGEAVPAENGVGSLLYQIQNAASDTRVDFGSISVSSPAGSTTGPAGSTASSSIRPASSGPAAGAAGPAAASGGVGSQTFSFNFTGDFFHLASFFGRLQQFVAARGKILDVRGRLMTLNSIQLQPGPHGFPEISANVTATTYSVPAVQIPLAPSNPGTAALAASAAPVASPVPSAPPTAAITR